MRTPNRHQKFCHSKQCPGFCCQPLGGVAGMMVTLVQAWTPEAPGVGAPPMAGLSSPPGGPVLN